MGQFMNTKCVRDVIGEPESWPNHKGAACGETFSTFVVEDPELRDRLTQILRANQNVHEAVAAEI
jgi:hypothetical protein